MTSESDYMNSLHSKEPDRSKINVDYFFIINIKYRLEMFVKWGTATLL